MSSLRYRTLTNLNQSWGSGSNPLKSMVAGVGFEPTTFGL